jgi:DNA-binding GntR family transcriptional regulator
MGSVWRVRHARSCGRWRIRLNQPVYDYGPITSVGLQGYGSDMSYAQKRPTSARTSARSKGKSGATGKSEIAYETLRERILDGTYGPGYRLVVDALGRELGMSPIPLREAVRRLEAEGWVISHRHVGAQVAPAELTQWIQGMEALALLEGAAMGLLARVSVSTIDLDEARRLNLELRDAVARLSVADAHRINREFHLALYASVPNEPLVAMLKQIWDGLTRRRRSVSFYIARAPDAAEEHDELIAMLERGEAPDVVERFSRQHKIRTLEVFFRENGLERDQSLLLRTPADAPAGDRLPVT